MNGWLLASLFRAKSKVGRCLIGNPAQDNPRLNGKKKSARQREKAGRR